MPELPEVETVKRGLNKIILESTNRCDRLELFRKDLRWPFPKGLKKNIEGSELLEVARRAKYLLFRFNTGTMINHLGMTGTWRELAVNEKRKTHDHMLLRFGDRRFVFNDPRRFGSVEWTDDEVQFFKIKKLGPEPLSRTFNVDYLWPIFKRRQASVKNIIMNQKVVVGVGNIYACEALFLAKISPVKICQKISRAETEQLIREIKTVLKRAIRAGGTTISDFRNAGGSAGYFQQKLLVYGREGSSCHHCGRAIRNQEIGGRSSFYCPHCQKR